MPRLTGSARFDKVVVLHYRPLSSAGQPKVEERIVEFDRLPAPLPGEDIEAVFCCVGTTQNRAGSTEAFQKIDRDLPIALARWAAEHNTTTLVCVSSVDAKAGARSVYLRTKGEMEAGVAGAGLRSTYLLRPSLLAGERDEFRLVERIGNGILGVVEPIMVGPLRKYRAVQTKTVAKAMLACAEQAAPGVHIVESDAIQELGR